MNSLTINKLTIYGWCHDENRSCCHEEFLHRFIGQTRNTSKKVKILDLIGGLNTTSDLLVIANELLPVVKMVEFALDCADAIKHLNKTNSSLLALSYAKELLVNQNTLEANVLFDLAKDELCKNEKPVTISYRAILAVVYYVYGVNYKVYGLIKDIVEDIEKLNPLFDFKPLLTKLFTVEQ